MHLTNQGVSAHGHDGAASWADARAGVREEAAFSPVGDGAILTVVHRPLDRRPQGAVLICSSLYEDLQLHYRRDLLVARDLARDGCAVVRFHYRGAGDSGPAPSGSPTMASLLEDAHAALDLLLRQQASGPLVVYAGRAGALVAAELCAASAASGAVLVGPALSGEDYFRGMTRAGKVAGLRGDDEARTASFTEQFADRGFADVLGSRVTRTSYADIVAHRVEPVAFARTPVLLVQVAASESLSRVYAGFRDDVAGVGGQVETMLVRAREQWFVPDQWEPEDEAPETRATRDGIVAWVRRLGTDVPA